MDFWILHQNSLCTNIQELGSFPIPEKMNRYGSNPPHPVPATRPSQSMCHKCRLIASRGEIDVEIKQEKINNRGERKEKKEKNSETCDTSESTNLSAHYIYRINDLVSILVHYSTSANISRSQAKKKVQQTPLL